MKRTNIIALAALASGIAIGAWFAGGEETIWQPWQPAAAQTSAVVANSSAETYAAPPAAAELTLDEQRNIRVYETANRSVVNIDTTIVERDDFWNLQRQAEGSGSGAVIDKQGHIVTNYHVIDGISDLAQKIDVTLASNQTYSATYVGGDKEHDIAVLKIDAPPEQLFPITMGGSDKLRVGQRVYAVGNPFGWDGTMTTGIISSLNRNLPSRVPGREMHSLIQTDAAMNPGNSGGPLLDSSARMIGMCVAISSRTGQNTGIGFAIPIDRIKSILPELIDHGRLVRGDIGISHVMETGNGLIVARVTEGGPADRAGIKGFRVVVQRRQRGGFTFNETTIDRSQADRILAVDGEEMRTGVQFQDKIWSRKPGESVTLTILRDGSQLEVPLTLEGS
jgi:S1-C subfamily serine protease